MICCFFHMCEHTAKCSSGLTLPPYVGRKDPNPAAPIKPKHSSLCTDIYII